jgi:hypothetical protein
MLHVGTDFCLCVAVGRPLRSTRLTNRNYRSIIFVQYITAGKTKYSLLHNIGLRLVHFRWIPGAFTRRMKRPGRETDHSSSSNIELKE